MPNTLSVAAWKKVLKDHADAADAAPVTKALEAFGKAEPKSKDDPEALLDAVKEVIDAARDAKASNARDKKKKDLVAFLGDLAGDAATQKVKAERLVQEKKEREREGPDEDEDGNDEGLKLTGMLLKVKKLDADRAKPFVLALGGKVHGLVIAKTSALSGEHKKRARAMRQGNGRLMTGKAYGDKGKFVFEFPDKPPGGVAKAVRKAAGAHTKLPPIKVIVRGAGTEFDDDNDADEMADLGTDTGDDAAVTPPSAPPREGVAPSAPPPPSTLPPRVADQFKTLYAQAENRLAAVRRLVPANADALVPLLAEAKGHADGGRAKEALEALKAFQVKANAALKPGASPSPKPTSSAPDDAPLPAAAVAAWTAARNDTVAQIRAVSKAVAATKDPGATKVIIRLQSIISNLTAVPADRRGVAELLRYVETDDVITAAEEVPPSLGALTIRRPLLDALAAFNK